MSMITKEEVLAAQKAWAEGIVHIGDTFTKGGDYVQAAKDHIDTLYAYDISTVLFKPTKAAKVPFRGTKTDALSYFVKGEIQEDGGFAIQPWNKVVFDNHNIILQDSNALASGEYYFTDANTNDVVKVEYSFGYIKDQNGKLRINLHHSSIPFSG